MAKRAKRGRGLSTWPLYLLLVIVFILYIYYQRVQPLAIVFGVSLFFMIVVLIAFEVVNSVREEGYIRNIAELAIAVGIIILLWFVLKFVLQTNYPLDVVPSCSMLPRLQRGDMVALQGIGDITQVKAPIVDVSRGAYQNMLNNIMNEQLFCVAYNKTNGKTEVSQFLKPGYSIGLYQGSSDGGVIISPNNQSANLITYTCGARKVQFSNGTVEDEVYTTAITVAGTTIIGDNNNTVVVYQTIPGDSFYSIGDRYIIHRVYAIIDAGGDYYMLTKGDNNPGLDIQYGNYPANKSYVEGRVIASVPYLGYLKLILSNQFSEPAGCNYFAINST